MDEKQLQALYDAMSKNMELGTYGSFKSLLGSDAKYRKAFYDQASQDLDLGDYQTFDKSFAPKKQGLQPMNVSAQQVKQFEEVGQQREREFEPVIDVDDPIKTMLAPSRKYYGEAFTNYMKAARNTGGESVGQQTLSKVTKANIDQDAQERVRMDADGMAKADVLQESMKREVVPDANVASLALSEYAKKNNLPLRTDADGIAELDISSMAALPRDNETLSTIVQRIDEYKKLKEIMGSAGGDVKSAAAIWYRQQNSHFDKQLSRIQEANPNSNSFDENIPPVLYGKIINSFIQDENVKLLAGRDENSKKQYDNLKANLLTEIPEYGIYVVANELSREREKRGRNNWLANFAFGSSEYMDKLAEDFYKDDPVKKQIYDAHIKNNINKYIDTPGFIDKAERGVEHSFGGMKNSVLQWLGLKSEGSTIYDALDKENSQISAEPEGLLHQISSASGDFSGLIASMYVGGNLLKGMGLVRNPNVANKLMTGITFYGDEMEEAAKLYPGETDKQFLRAGLSVAAFASASSLMPTKQLDAAMKKISPEIDNVVKMLSEGKISLAAAKDQMTNGFAKLFDFGKDVAKQDLKITGEMTAITAFKQAMDKVLSLKEEVYNEAHSNTEIIDVAKSTLMGGLVPGAITVKGERKMMSNVIYDIASKPERYRRLLGEQEFLDEGIAATINEKTQLIDKLATTKAAIDEIKMPEKQQKSYLLQTANEHLLQQKISRISDPLVRKKYEKELADTMKKKESILNYEEIAEEEVKEPEEAKETTEVEPDEISEPIELDPKVPESFEPKFTEEDSRKVWVGDEKPMHERKDNAEADIKSFSDRIAKGEKIESPEDLQFYENNKAAIEKELLAKQKETTATEDKVTPKPAEEVEKPAAKRPAPGDAIIEKAPVEVEKLSPAQQGEHYRLLWLGNKEAGKAEEAAKYEKLYNEGDFGKKAMTEKERTEFYDKHVYDEAYLAKHSQEEAYKRYAEQNAPKEAVPEEAKITPAEIKVEEKKAVKAVDKKIEELTDNDKSTTAKMKAQKKDIVEQLDEIEGILWGDTPKEKRKALDEAGKNAPIFDQNLHKLKDAGYDVKGEMITIQVKDDGEFRFHHATVPMIAEKVKREFPDKPVGAPKVPIKKSSPNSNYRGIALERGSTEKSRQALDIAKENLATAKKAGNEKLQEVYAKEIEREERIFEQAEHIDWKEEAAKAETAKRKAEAEKEMPENKEVAKWNNQYNKDRQYYRELGFHPITIDDYMLVKESGLLDKGYSFEQVQLLLENPGKTGNDIKTKYETNLSALEKRLQDRFQNKSGGLRTPKTKSEKSEFLGVQNSINASREKIRIADRILTKDKKNESTDTKAAGKDKQGKQSAEETEQAAGTTAKDSEGTEQASTSQKLEQKYSQVAGLKPKVQPGRIPVEPIVGGKAKALSDIIFDVTTGLKQRTFFAKFGRRRSAGSYSPSNKGIAIKYQGDLDTTAHEIGHALDDAFGLLTETSKDPDAVKELKDFSIYGSKPPKGHPDPKSYRLAEGWAEFIRAVVVNPEAAKAAAPKTFAIYDRLASTEAKKSIDDFSTDVRTWAGSSAGDIILSNVEFEPKKEPGTLQQLFDKQSTSNKFTINWSDRFSANMINPLRVFEKAWKYAKEEQGTKDVLPENDPVILSRVLLGLDGKFGEILKSGMINGRGEVLKDADGNAKNMNWLLEPLDNTDQASIRRDMEDTIKYMVAERTLELGKRFGRGSILTGVGGGIFKDADIAKQTLNEIKSGDPDRLARIEQAAERYRDFADDVLMYLVDKGRMSAEQYNYIKKDNTQYVAMQRVLEADPESEIVVYQRQGGKVGNVNEPLHKIKGSTKKIINPYTSLIDTLHKSVREADRNDVLRAFRDMIYEPRMMHSGDPKRFSDIGVQGTGKNSIPIYIDGKKESWIFQQDIYKALKGLDHDAYKLPAFATFHARALRFTTTNFPTFALRNFIRDTQDRLIKSNENRGLSGLKNLFGKKEDWGAIARAGGLNAGYYMKDKKHYYGLMKEAMDGIAKKKNIMLLDGDSFKKAWTGYTNILQKSETSNRVAEFRSARDKAKRRGMDDYNAALYGAYKARDLIDFGIAGHWMKVVNQIIPFSNAAVQGLRSTIVRGKENPAGFLARTMLYSVVPSAALWFWNHRNKEDGDEYEDFPAHMRDMLWMFKVGDNKWGGIPKPYELSLASGATDRALSKWVYGNKDAFNGYAGTVRKSLLPFDEGNFAAGFQSVLETITNYDLYRDKYIIPPNEDALYLALRHYESASRLGQLLQGVTKIDARKIDHFIKGQFSYMGNLAIDISDTGREGSKYGFDVTDTGLFKNSPAYNSPSVQEFIGFAKGLGLTLTPQYRDFAAVAGEYFAATKDSDKDRLARELIELAEYQLQAWKDEGIKEEKIEEAEEKKEAKKL